MSALAHAYLPSPRIAVRVWQRDLRVFSKIWKQGLLPQFFE